jgi:amidase
MTLRRPSRADLEQLGRERHLQLTETELEEMHELVCDSIALYDQLEQTPEPQRETVAAVRTLGTRPTPAEDPHNAIVRRVSVRLPDAKGKLSGKTVGIKDTISIAGIPMGGASRVLYDYTPVADAPIVTRILKAGGHIIAVTNTDDFAFSGAGHTSAHGVMTNPSDPAHTAGGSSGGSAIAVGTRLVDLAMGGDQGGSIRMPAAWTGTVGHKPTHGLVPYTGILGFDMTLDHIGPHARTVEDAALLLSVVAGKDDENIDPRQPSSIKVQDYAAALSGDLKGLKIAVLKEGFMSPGAMEEVNRAVREAIKVLPTLGATVKEISIPEHLSAVAIWNSIAAEGGMATFYSGLQTYQHKGWYDTRLMSAMGRGIKSHGGDFSPTAKAGILMAAYMNSQYDGVFYGRARNLANELNKVYEKVFAQYDLIVMPTTPQTAHEVPKGPEEDRKTFVRVALNMIGNCAPFDMTGHPSISVPCHDIKRLPVGLMFTGRMFDDATVLRAAHAYEMIDE